LEELNEENWLYVGKEPEDKINWQLSVLNRVKDFVPILEE